jgi:hypothetical protein
MTESSLPAEREVQWVPLEELKGDPRNPKAHSLEQIDDSFERFGVVDLITIDGRTGFILSGHGRAQVLKDKQAAGDDPPEGVRISTATGQWFVPVVAGWSSANDAEAAGALIAMNRLTELGGWVDEPLLNLLEELANTPDQFDGVGYSETDMEDLQHLLDDAAILPDDDDKDDSSGSAPGGKAVTVKLSDPGAIALWHEVRDTVKTDDAAFRVLAGLDPKPKAAKVAKKKSRVTNPSQADLDAAVGLDPAYGFSTVQTPVDNSKRGRSAADTDLDWDTATMAVPQAEGNDTFDDEEEFEIDLTDLPDVL